MCARSHLRDIRAANGHAVDPNVHDAGWAPYVGFGSRLSVIRSMSRKKVEDAADGADASGAVTDPLGKQLRDLFRAVEAAPLPDDIRRLVGDLEAKRQGRSRGPKRN